MVFDLADTVALGVDVKNAAGTLVNASAITLTITLPDGTTSTPAVSNPSTGRYEYDYPTVQAGRHLVRWVATSPGVAYTDAFDVRSAAGIGIVSLADVKEHLNIPAATTTHDEELRGFIDCATDVIEHVSGTVLRRTVVETHSGAGQPALVLRQPPVISITSVTENGVAVASTGYSLDDNAGVLYRATSYVAGAWLAGINNIVIAYLAGRTIVRASIQEAGKELVRINWRPQQGGSYSPFDREPAEAGQTRLGYFVPHGVMRLLRPTAEPPRFG